MKNTLLTIVSIFALGSTNAQVSISPVGGVDVVGQSVQIVGGDYATDMHVGPCAGVFVDVPLKGLVSPQAGLLYKLYTWRFNGALQTYGGSQRYEDHRIIYTTLDIPVRLIYSFPQHHGGRFFAGAGPYFRFNVSASDHVHGHYYDPAGREINPYDRVDYYPSGRVDIGAGISGGFRAAKGWLICLQGEYSISNHESSPYQAHYYNFGIIGGYSFKTKKHKVQAEEPAN